jgi:hypothetical protein
MKKLIVKADDFGLTAGVNQAILDEHALREILARIPEGVSELMPPWFC